ncbi:hypothetical protein PspCFBP13509_31080 [Pseudomonas sp. CFBP13509]|nr:hypothetical protein PspCFBP13509_31080 [Pseudomonas sp. CFBP13509]
MKVLGLLRSPARGKPAHHRSLIAIDSVVTGSCVDTHAHRGKAPSHIWISIQQADLSLRSGIPSLGEVPSGGARALWSPKTQKAVGPKAATGASRIVAPPLPHF